MLNNSNFCTDFMPGNYYEIIVNSKLFKSEAKKNTSISVQRTAHTCLEKEKRKYQIECVYM